MKNILFLILLLVKVLFGGEKITIMTEEFPPFNYTENGEITGVSTEIVEAVFKEAGLEYEIKVFPWSRTFNEAQREKNSAIFSVMRLPEREKLFKWVGELVVPKFSVFALKYRDDIVVNSFQDLKKYKMGTAKDDARERFFLKQGFVAGVNIDQVAGTESNSQNLKKLEIKRIDLWPMPDAVAEYIVRKEGKDPSQLLRRVYALDELSKTGYFLAMNKGTSDEVVLKLQTAMKKLKKSGYIGRILEKWHIK